MPLILVAVHRRARVPALNSRVISDQSLFVYGDRRADARLHRLRHRGLPRRHRVGASEPADGGPLARAQLRAGDALRRPAAGDPARVPPLLNDFIGLQKDTAIITVIGVVEALAQAGFYSSDYFNYAGYTVAAVFFILLHDPVRPLHGPPDQGAGAAGAGAGRVSEQRRALRHARAASRSASATTWSCDEHRPRRSTCTRSSA